MTPSSMFALNVLYLATSTLYLKTACRASLSLAEPPTSPSAYRARHARERTRVRRGVISKEGEEGSDPLEGYNRFDVGEYEASVATGEEFYARIADAVRCWSGPLRVCPTSPPCCSQPQADPTDCSPLFVINARTHVKFELRMGVQRRMHPSRRLLKPLVVHTLAVLAAAPPQRGDAAVGAQRLF
jgi:hypothetical protein